MSASCLPTLRRWWPRNGALRYGLFTAGYCLSWFLGSAAIGFPYTRTITGTILRLFIHSRQYAALPKT
jgi:hypothetical protein